MRNNSKLKEHRTLSLEEQQNEARHEATGKIKRYLDLAEKLFQNDDDSDCSPGRFHFLAPCSSITPSQDSLRKACISETTAVLSSLSHANGFPSMARFTVLNNIAEKSWR
jgi:hypothetical protein